MVFNRMMSELDATKSQLFLLVGALLLTIDEINPIKIILHVFAPYGLSAWHITVTCLYLATHLIISENQALLYFGVKVFLHSILSIFFQNIEIIGLDNIPQNGPVIFVGNHANQFVDGLTMMSTCANRKVSFLIAEKSWNRAVIGDFAKAMDAVPVSRAQDDAKKGVGLIRLTSTSERPAPAAAAAAATSEPAPAFFQAKISGVFSGGADFGTQLKLGDKVRPVGCPEGFKVVSFESRTSLTIDVGDAEAVAEFKSKMKDGGVAFDVLGRVDQTAVYAQVLAKLGSGGTIGIFPEGGSHDRTDLLPLKVGVALIVYEALKSRGVVVPIVPVGLNYFNAHRFRGRAVVEYGQPIYADPETLKDYIAGGEGKKKVCNALLERVKDGMRSVIVATPDWETLRLVHSIRRLYKRGRIDTKEKQDLNRRFAYGMQQLLLKGGLPSEVGVFVEKVKEYQKELDDIGLKDYQVMSIYNQYENSKGGVQYRFGPTFGPYLPDDLSLFYKITHLVLTMLFACIPAVLLNLPVGLICRIVAEGKRKKALQASKVKIEAIDVLLSEKILLSMWLVPTVWVAYGCGLILFTNFDRNAIALSFISLPIFSYFGVIHAEAGMIDLKDLKPYFMKLLPSTRKRMHKLPEARKQLVAELNTFVKKFGPQLGELYFEKEVDWTKVQRVTKEMEETAGGQKGAAAKKKE